MIDNNKPEYDLEERTAVFAEDIVAFCKAIPRSVVTLPLITQLVKSGTSLGANYCEANGAASPKDFLNKICISKKEIKETSYWLRVIIKAVPELREETEKLQKETDELIRIFATIYINSKKKITNLSI